MLKQAIFAIGHLVTRIALLKPLRHCRLMQETYSLLYGCAKYLLEQPEYRFFRSHLCEGMTILDIGAHTGYYSRLFSSLVGAQGRVYSFEPDPWSFEVLRGHTYKRNNIKQVSSAVGDAVRRSYFYPNARSRADSSLFPRPFSGEPIVVGMTTIDSFCSEQNVPRIDAMKIDVEGAETTVLRGAKELLRKHSPSWIALELYPEVLLREGSSVDDLCTLLRHFGYELHSLSSRGEPVPIGDIHAFVSDCSLGYTNIVAIRKHPISPKNATLHCTCGNRVSAHK